MRHLILFASLAVIGRPVMAGRLADFSNQLKDKSPSAAGQNASSSDCDPGEDSCGSFLGSLFGNLFEAAGSQTMEYWRSRQPGEPALPAARIDQTYQRVEGRIDGYASHAELGLGPLATSLEFLRYWEQRPKDRLDSWQADALWRLSSSPGLRLNAALGYRAFQLHGQSPQEGAQGGFSIGIFSRRGHGLEGDFRWISINGNAVGDHRARVLVRLLDRPTLSLHAGYRAIRAQGSTLRGPEAGLTVVW